MKATFVLATILAAASLGCYWIGVAIGTAALLNDKHEGHCGAERLDVKTLTDPAAGRVDYNPTHIDVGNRLHAGQLQLQRCLVQARRCRQDIGMPAKHLRQRCLPIILGNGLVDLPLRDPLTMKPIAK